MSSLTRAGVLQIGPNHDNPRQGVNAPQQAVKRADDGGRTGPGINQLKN